jgi:hypothetical protein
MKYGLIIVLSVSLNRKEIIMFCTIQIQIFVPKFKLGFGFGLGMAYTQAPTQKILKTQFKINPSLNLQWVQMSVQMILS